MPDLIVKLDVEAMELMVGNELNLVINKFVDDLEAGITRMQLSGMTEIEIKKVLARDLAQGGGRTFSQVKNGFKNSVNTGINTASRKATDKVYKENGADKLMWVTLSGRPCPDCNSRHGRVETREYWETVGEPGSGFSVCQGHCKCDYVPSNYKSEGLDKALIWESPDKR